MISKTILTGWIFALVASPILALNILLSSTDSWVHKNVRLLQQSLVENNHTVVVVGPLYKHNSEDILDSIAALEDRSMHDDSTIIDGGDFGHLLPVHQTYYRTIKRLNAVQRRAKNVISKKSLEEISQEKVDSTVHNRFFGQDPLDHSAWYVNADPRTSLLIGLDVILPEYYPTFKPDVILVGPNEGLALTNKELTNSSMMEVLKLGMMKNVPTIGISTEDSHDIYFQDEHFFNAQETVMEKVLKKNVFGKNIRFINEKVIELLNSIQWESFTPRTAMNINIPSINHDNSYCFTTHSKMKLNVNPQFQHISYPSEAPECEMAKLPRLVFSNERGLHAKGYYSIDITTPSSDSERVPASKRQDEDEDITTFVDEKSYYYLQTVKNYARSSLASIERGTKSMLIQKRDVDFADRAAISQETSSIISKYVNPEEVAALQNCHIPVNILSISKGTGIREPFFPSSN